MVDRRHLVILKARQLGITWLALAYATWLLLFRAPATILLFSLREEEAKELLWRLRQIYDHLPDWLHCAGEPKCDDRQWRLSNGSRALAFSTRAGRSYTGTLALVDEADFVPDLGRFLSGVKPTIDAGGQLFLISTSDKSHPVSPFKNLFRAATSSCLPPTTPDPDGSPLLNLDYFPIFLPWSAHPDRNDQWRDRIRTEMFAQRGTHDDFLAEYPATPEDALAPEQLDRRLPYDWLTACFDAHLAPMLGFGPSLPGLTVYELPVPGRRYVIGADPAEGSPTSDDSAACILDATTFAEVATLAGKLEPTVFASYLNQVGAWYNSADILVERNNHGHLVLRELERLGALRRLSGHDDKPGWVSNVKGKPLLYDLAADALRDATCRLRSPVTLAQLASIEASTLRAPSGLKDDCADAFALALAALAWRPPAIPSHVVEALDPVWCSDHGLNYDGTPRDDHFGWPSSGYSRW